MNKAESQEIPVRIAVLISGSGSNLQALIDAIESRQLVDIEIAVVISNRADAYGIQRALRHLYPTVYIPWTKKAQQAEAEARILQLIRVFNVDLVVLAGWMRIFSSDFIAQFPQRIINLHPALLPDEGEETYTTKSGAVIPALRGLHVVQKAIEAEFSVTGSTVHYVVPAVDAGPVIARVEIAILSGDTEETLQERLKEREHALLIEAVCKCVSQIRLLVH